MNPHQQEFHQMGFDLKKKKKYALGMTANQPLLIHLGLLMIFTLNYSED